MANKEKILMVLPSYETDPDKHESTRENVKKLQQVNLEPVYINVNLHNEEEQDALYNSASGILLAGGVDIDPKYFNQDKHPATVLIDKKRDSVEMRILQKILSGTSQENEYPMPFLGVCRGMQALAVACGGELMQHIPDVTPEKHGRSTDDPQEDHVRHEVLVVYGTKAHEIYGDHIGSAESRHHQAVKEPNPDQNLRFIVSGRSPGGIVEIIELKDHPFGMAVQYHPEYKAEDPIYIEFAKAVQKRAERHIPPLAA